MELTEGAFAGSIRSLAVPDPITLAPTQLIDIVSVLDLPVVGGNIAEKEGPALFPVIFPLWELLPCVTSIDAVCNK